MSEVFFDAEMTDEERLVKKIGDWIKKSQAHSQDWREDAIEDFDFYANRQWSSEDEAKLREEGRPIITFDRTAPVINSVSGYEVSNRQEIKYIPRTLDDTGGTDMYTYTAKWARDETDADDEQSDAFKDAIICGMGWTSTAMDYETNPDGIPREIRISPFQMYWDPSARRQNLADARYVIRKIEAEKDDVMSMWPDQIDDLTMGDEDDDFTFDSPHDATDAPFYRQNAGFDRTRNKFIIHECQWWERQPYYRVYDERTGKTVEFPKDRFEMMQAKAPVPMQGVLMMKKVYYRAVISGKTLLEPKKESPVQGEFTYQCITGFRDERTGLWSGIMRSMKDPQRWSNKFFSQFLDIVSANSKGGLLYETGAFANPRKAEKDWSNPAGMLEVSEGGLEKIRERQQQPFPSSTDRLLQLAVGATRDVTGINLEFLGLANREQAGVIETERKRSAINILADIFNSLRRFKRKQGRVLLQYIHRFMRDGQVIRIMGQEGAQYMEFKKDASAMSYDVIVDTAPDSPNMKQETWGILQNLIPALAAQGIPIPPDVVRFLPIPAGVANEWIKFIQERSQPSPEQQMQQQMEMGDKQATIAEKFSKAKLNEAKVANINAPQEAQILTAAMKVNSKV